MQKKHKVIIIFLTPVLLFLIMKFSWISYVMHLGKHQSSSILSRTKISSLLSPPPSAEKTSNKLNSAEIKKLLLIQEGKEFAKKLYELNESKSFEYYVNLHRQALGWNLTIAPAFEMKAKEFYFPVIGKFGYLGFFDEKIKNSWKEKFQSREFDVYENEIGAYSTLGYFRDPIYSTYLKFSDNQLLSLIFHEMVHEKLYLKNDSDFSESMAAFMEQIALNLYLFKQVNAPEHLLLKHKKSIDEYNKFQDILENSKKNLESLYASELPLADKKILKKIEFDTLRKNLKTANFQYLPYAQKVSEQTDLNNAFLVQNSRYTPKAKNGFSVLLKDCNNDIACWFNELEKLGHCNNEARKKFMSEEITLEATLLLCQ